MTPDEAKVAEILNVANRVELRETGGAHNQKGVDFQRYWALMRIFQVEDSGQDDFLFLFEAIQDVAEFDSSISPSSVTVYQVKKKDRGEWEWAGLTNLPSPNKKSKKPVPAEKLAKVKASAIGTLYASVVAFSEVESRGHFISNAGCNLSLIGGGNAATSVPCSLASLDPAYRELLKAGLEKVHKAGMPAPDLGRLRVERVGLHPDNLANTLIGQVTTFLHQRSPRHSGQAKSLVDSLITAIGPLGSKTDKCNTFQEMKERHGFTRKDLVAALGQLEAIPDLVEYLDDWIQKLTAEGMNFMEATAIRMAATAFYKRQVMGSHTEQEMGFITACDEWLKHHKQVGTLSQYFDEAHKELGPLHATLKKSEIYAIFALRAIARCVDQT